MRQMQGQNPGNKFTGHQLICLRAKIVAARISHDPLISLQLKPIQLPSRSGRRAGGKETQASVEEVNPSGACCMYEELTGQLVFSDGWKSNRSPDTRLFMVLVTRPKLWFWLLALLFHVIQEPWR